MDVSPVDTTEFQTWKDWHDSASAMAWLSSAQRTGSGIAAEYHGRLMRDRLELTGLDA